MSNFINLIYLRLSNVLEKVDKLVVERIGRFKSKELFTMFMFMHITVGLGKDYPLLPILVLDCRCKPDNSA